MVNNVANRLDLSEWIIHFVHDRKGHDDMYVQAKNSGWEMPGDRSVASERCQGTGQWHQNSIMV